MKHFEYPLFIICQFFTCAQQRGTAADSRGRSTMKRFFFLFLLFSTGAFAQNSPVAVADQTFRINGVHEFAYAFAEGDQIELSIHLIAGRQLKSVEFFQYPDRMLFRSYELDTLLHKTISAPQTGMYILRLTETGMGKKICRFTLQRTPTLPANARLDTRISWDWKQNGQYEIAQRQTPNGTKTEVVSLGGKVTVGAFKFGAQRSTNAYQFTLPPFTRQWAYRITVGQATQEARRKDSEKMSAALKTGAAKVLGYEPTSALAIYALGMAIDLSQSGSGQAVEYALVDANNLKAYLDGKKYDTYLYQAAVSADVQRRYSPLEGALYFGLRNKNWIDDIDVNIDIEAVTETPQYSVELYLAPLRP
ncbi:MAG: hypothetical protein KGS48_06685 [Bacteroidetes bacterium]|nr:hypothetical protein [Bacteroidota bacterium]